MKALLKFQSYLTVFDKEGKTYVFDQLRKKNVVLTPEEMVRQLFIQYLMSETEIPVKHIAVERKINLNGKYHRFDLLIFNKEGNPKMIVECKSFRVKLSEKTGIQIAKYNLSLKAEFLCITNGHDTLIYKIDIDKSEMTQLNYFPAIH